MPGRDGTGPMGRGEATGRGMGHCLTTAGRMGTRGMGRGGGRRGGAGLGYRRGMGFCRAPLTEAEEKSWLNRQKEALMEDLRYIQQLENELEEKEKQ